MSNTSRSRRAISCLTNKSDPLKDMTTEDRRQVLGLITKLEAADRADASQDEKDALLHKFFDKREEAAKAKAAAEAQANEEAARAETEVTEDAAKAKKAKDIACYNKLAEEHYAAWDEPDFAPEHRHTFPVTLRDEVRLIWDEKAERGYATDPDPTDHTSPGHTTDDVADDTYGGSGFR